jgi:Flp pilus assembly protein TadG
MSKTTGHFLSLMSACRGSAAIEFALIVPVLAAIVITISDVATIATGVGEMHTAARAAIQYGMNGGTDMTVAKTQGVDAWQNEPTDGSLTVVQSCTCSGASHSCSTTCSDGSSPYVFITATAKGTLGGSMIKQTKTVTEAMRQK